MALDLGTIIVIIGSIIVYQSHRQRKKIAWFSESVDLTGKTALVTGASSGIGFSTALQLAKRGAKVVLVSRKDCGARDRIISQSGNSDIEFVSIDLGQLHDIRLKSAEIKSKLTGLDFLINCAGTAFGPVENSNDGIEYTYQVNHFGPQLLIELLMEILEARHGRIVTLGSKQANHFGRVDIDHYTRGSLISRFHQRLEVYMNSKAMHTLYSLALADELAKRNSTVTINVAFPGLTQTNICQRTSLLFQLIWIVSGFIFFKYPVEGAQSVLYCALSAELKGISGKMISECREVDNIAPKQAKDEKFRTDFLNSTKIMFQ